MELREWFLVGAYARLVSFRNGGSTFFLSRKGEKGDAGVLS